MPILPILLVNFLTLNCIRQTEEFKSHLHPGLNTVIERKRGFQGGAVAKNLPACAGDARDGISISGSGRSSGVGNGNPLQYSCLENPKDRGAWWAVVHGVAKNQTQLSAGVDAHTHT